MGLCKRIIGVILIDKNLVVRREGFKTTSIIGHPKVTIKYLRNWNVDEIFFINVGIKNPSFYEVLDHATNEIFLPITAGGRISSLEEVDTYMKHGADKVVIGRNASEELINKIAEKYGSQAICLSVDEKHDEMAEYINNWPIGEVILHDKERDGKGEGLNLDILKHRFRFPKIAMGGVGCYDHIVDGLKHADAVAVGNLFHFKEVSAADAKMQAHLEGFNLRR